MRSALGGDNLDTPEEVAQKGLVHTGGLALNLGHHRNGSVALTRCVPPPRARTRTVCWQPAGCRCLGWGLGCCCACLVARRAASVECLGGARRCVGGPTGWAFLGGYCRLEVCCHVAVKFRCGRSGQGRSPQRLRAEHRAWRDPTSSAPLVVRVSLLCPEPSFEHAPDASNSFAHLGDYVGGNGRGAQMLVHT